MTPTGEIWAGTYFGLHYRSGDTMSVFNQDNSDMFSNAVTNIASDKQTSRKYRLRSSLEEMMPQDEWKLPILYYKEFSNCYYQKESS